MRRIVTTLTAVGLLSLAAPGLAEAYQCPTPDPCEIYRVERRNPDWQGAVSHSSDQELYDLFIIAPKRDAPRSQRHFWIEWIIEGEEGTYITVRAPARSVVRVWHEGEVLAKDRAPWRYINP